MSKSRKTIRVEELKSLINAMLLQDCSQNAKEALSIVIEETLHRTGNYQGFKYTNGSEHGWAERTDENRYDRHYY